ncbi:MAG TPA: hypothetical protein VGD29_27665 [Actinoplanes sp.]|jgi:hypothetical protein
MTARIAGLGVVLLVSLAGCGATSADPKPAASPEKKAPADVLLAAVPDEKSGPYHFTVVNSDGKLTGIVDAPEKAISIGITQKEDGVPVTLDMKFLILGSRSWVKIKFSPANTPGLPRIPSKWQLIDPSKIKDKDNSPLAYGDDQSDPGYAHEVIAGAGKVEQTSAGHYSGVTDLSRTGVEDIVDNDTVKVLGDKAKTVPFTAVTDAKGRLTRLDLEIPAAGKAKAHTYSAVYDGYDSTTTPAAPAVGEQQKAVSAVYDMLNS